MIDTFIVDKVNEVASLLDLFIPNYLMLGWSQSDVQKLALRIVTESGFSEDLDRFVHDDPSSKDSKIYTFSSSVGLEAMLYYRTAHELLAYCNEFNREYIERIAGAIRKYCSVNTMVDINPFAQIGPGCVIDHGIGTSISPEYIDGYGTNHTIVIGEETIIGNNCTILNDVVIGARLVNKGKTSGRRHPTIGNGVTICAGAKVLGDIRIGDNVLIGPGCYIIHNVPDNTKVYIINQLQIVKAEEKDPIQLDAVVTDGQYLILYGEKLENLTIQCVNDKYETLDCYETEIIEKDNYYAKFKIDFNTSEEFKRVYVLKILINDRYYYVDSPIVNRYLRRIIAN